MRNRAVVVRWVWRVDPDRKMVRVARVLWGRAPHEPGHKNRLSLALRPALWHSRREFDGWSLTLCGVRLHLKRHPLGVMV